jgi:hypothetical protein
MWDVEVPDGTATGPEPGLCILWQDISRMLERLLIRSGRHEFKPQDIVANIGNANWKTSTDRTAMDNVIIESGRDGVVTVAELLRLDAEAFVCVTSGWHWPKVCHFTLYNRVLT